MTRETETEHLQDQGSTKGFAGQINPFVSMGNSANSRSRMTRLCDVESGQYLHLSGDQLTSDRNWAWLGNYSQARYQIRAWKEKGHRLIEVGPQ